MFSFDLKVLNCLITPFAPSIVSLQTYKKDWNYRCPELKYLIYRSMLQIKYGSLPGENQEKVGIQ